MFKLEKYKIMYFPDTPIFRKRFTILIEMFAEFSATVKEIWAYPKGLFSEKQLENQERGFLLFPCHFFSEN